MTAAGERLPEFVDEPLTVTDFVRYQGASGDLSPLHHDVDLAREAGFPTVFAPGMLIAGILGSYLAGLYGESAVRRFKVAFHQPAWPGDVLTYGGEVEEVTPDVVHLALHVRGQSGDVTARAWATVVRRPRPEPGG